MYNLLQVEKTSIVGNYEKNNQFEFKDKAENKWLLADWRKKKLYKDARATGRKKGHFYRRVKTRTSW